MVVGGVCYRMCRGVALRGWEKLPWAVVRRPENKIHFLREEEFRALELCSGRIDCSLALIPENIREQIGQMERRGIVERCAYGADLEEDQIYRRYPNRFVGEVYWSITGKCNYRCKHCYLSAPGGKFGELSHEETMDIIDQMDGCGVLSVALSGGEPLIRRDWWDIVDALLQKKIAVRAIYTNGALVNEALLDGLEARGIHPLFDISYDGDGGWHDWLRGVKGAGARALAAFDLCKKRGFPTGAEMALHRGNAAVLRRSVNTLAAHGCARLKISGVADTELWKKYGGDYHLPAQEEYAVYERYIPEFFADGSPLAINLGGVFKCGKGSRTYTVPKEKCDGSDACLRRPVCGSARRTAYISPEGRLLPCMPLSACDVQSDFPLIRDVGLRQGLSESFYLSVADMRVEEFLARTKECAECGYAKVCAGGCPACALEAGGKNLMAGPDPSACLFFKGGWRERIRAAAESSRGGDADRSDKMFLWRIR